MGLVELPSELQLAIAGQLPSITCLARVHPRLREMVESLLYTDITFTWLTETPAPGAMLLLRTLLERPDLAQKIRTINLRSEGHHEINRHGFIYQLESLVLTESPPCIPGKRLLAQMHALGFTDQEIVATWHNHIRQAKSDAVVALIVALTPNITQLSLSEAWGGCYEYLGLVFSKALCPSQTAAYELPKYDQLTSVSLTPRFQYAYIIDAPKDDDILALFYLPNIRDLTLPIATRSSMTWPDYRAPRPETLTTLGIHRLREQCLRSVLSVCPNLESLYYRWLHNSNLDRPFNPGTLVLDEIALPIAQHCRRRLKLLRLDAHTDISCGDAEDPPITVSGSLMALKSLCAVEELTMPWAFVYGTVDEQVPDGLQRVLPATTRKLQLTSQLSRYEEYWWESDEILGLIRGEIKAGLLDSARVLGGIRISRQFEFDPTKYGEEPVETELDRLRADNFDVKVYDVDPSIYIELRQELQHHEDCESKET